MRPDFGLLLADSCVYRGEEKKGSDNGNRNEVKDDSNTIPDGCMTRPHIFSVGSHLCLSRFPVIPSGGLSYHVIGASITLAAILPPKYGSLQVVDLITADLSSRRERIKNASRMIKMWRGFGS